MALIEKELEPGENPHLYVKEKYPLSLWKYKDNSMDKNFILKKAAKAKQSLLLKTYAGTYYLFTKGNTHQPYL